LNTIITPTMLAGVPFKVALASLLPAIPFMLAHEIADFVFFATAGPVLVSAILKASRAKGGTTKLPSL
jgi:multisubunit Na+/H+ antiporter MnhG subunit